MVHFSPLSPTIIATFLAVFGGTGMICIKVFEMSNYGSIPVALVVGLGISTVIFFAMEWVFRKTQASTNIESGRLIGEHADVITPIPPGGVGEIAYVVRGTRQNAPARAADGKAIESPAEVEIIRVVGSSFVVRRVAPDEETAPPVVPED
jgi:membrane-bound ClpP family serine protease